MKKHTLQHRARTLKIEKYPCPPRRVLLAILIACALTPVETASAPAENFPTEPFEQEFIVTAYYSPLPGQCCYVLGTLAADQEMNGMGVRSADGTDVYPGMLAAPPRYPFGTRIALPGIGSVTVRDRGGAIQELDGGMDRLDLWVGSGEEGLARALAFGVKRIRGSVYPEGTLQPQESIAFDALPSPIAMLRPYLATEPDLLSLSIEKDDRSLAVELLQKHLKDAGYFGRGISGLFGSETQDSLAAFMKDFSLDGPSDRLTERTAAYLVAAASRAEERDPFLAFVDKDSAPDVTKKAKRILRGFGYYRGRTSGAYDDALFAAILKFQVDHALVSKDTDIGAGRIGPLTKQKVLFARTKRLVARKAEKLLMFRRIEQVLAERGRFLEEFLAMGDRGSSVRLLQSFLSERGFFPGERISGLFGPVTREAVLAYQMAMDIVQGESDKGAGYVGPATLASLKREQKRASYRLVRAEGWRAL